MVFEFKLPDIGEGIHEGEIVRWLVKEGDAVREDQPIVEVMTDKATVELTAPRSGKIADIRAKEGEVIAVGTIFVTIEEGAAAAKAAPPKVAASKIPPEAPAKKDERTLFEGQPVQEMVKRRRQPTSAPAQTMATPEKVSHPAGRPIAAPAVRRRARELGVDLETVRGSGDLGRITASDLESVLARPEGPAPRATAPMPAARPTTPTQPRPGAISPVTGRYRAGDKIPFRGLRRKISEGMRLAKDTAAHYTYVEEVDATELVRLREAAAPLAERSGIKITFLPFIVKATVAALKDHPIVNARLNEKEGVIELLDRYHIGFAVATENGLIVPVIKDADRRSVLEIARDLEVLSEKTRQGKASVEELTGSTFTITSLGKLGGVLATPIINVPEVGILGVHKISDKPVVRNGQIVVGKTMNLSFTFDHRIVDGAVGAEFAQSLVRYLEDPKLLLLQTL